MVLGGGIITDLIIKGVCKKIFDEFEMPVYTEKVLQGLEEPCFFVYMKSSVCSLFMGRRYIMKNKICIEYLAPYQVENSSCGGIVERLCMVLEKIECDGIVRGSNFTCEISDGTLIMTVDYNMFVYKQEQAEDSQLMQDMKLNQEV